MDATWPLTLIEMRDSPKNLDNKLFGTTMTTLKLRKPLERHLRAGHPWVYRDALEQSDVQAGSVVDILDTKGKPIARGLAENGPIAARIFSIQKDEINVRLFQARLRQAFDMRRGLMPPNTDAIRLVHGEGDRLPGVAIDKYKNVAVMKFDGDAIREWRPSIVEALTPLLPKWNIDTLLLREGRRGAVNKETLFGPLDDSTFAVEEHGMKLVVDVIAGQKTGLFLDQRESRKRVLDMRIKGPVLNLYSYTGGFSVAAGLGGAHRVVSVDIGEAAIDYADRSWKANGLDVQKHKGVAADVFEFLASEKSKYELIIADPPSFAPNEESVESAIRAYTKIHQQSMRAILPGGYYLAASCSSHIDHITFADTVRRAAEREHKILQVLDMWRAPFDHPHLLAFPESNYLKAFLFRVT